MKRIKSRTIAMNPLANATGKLSKDSSSELTLDTSKLSVAKLQQLALPTTVKLKLHKIEMPVLPKFYMVSSQGYQPERLGEKINDYFNKHRFVKWALAPAGPFGYLLGNELQNALNNKDYPYTLYTTRYFKHNDNKAWGIFSEKYASGDVGGDGKSSKLAALTKNINDWFELQFRAKVQDIAETQDKEEKLKKEEELKNYIQNKLLKDKIEEIVVEAAEDKEDVKKAIEAFVLNPADVVKNQLAYRNKQLVREDYNGETMATKMKKGAKYKGSGNSNRRKRAINSINEFFDWVAYTNNNIYRRILSERPFYDYLQAVNDNIDAAFKYIDNFDSGEVSRGQTRNYTKELGDFVRPDEYKDGYEDFQKKNNKWVILAAGGILAAVIYFKKKKSL